MDRGRVGEDRGSKETDGCPLTLFPRVNNFYIHKLMTLDPHPCAHLSHIGRVSDRLGHIRVTIWHPLESC
jgi:hypothetical protein